MATTTGSPPSTLPRLDPAASTQLPVPSLSDAAPHVDISLHEPAEDAGRHRLAPVSAPKKEPARFRTGSTPITSRGFGRRWSVVLVFVLVVIQLEEQQLPALDQITVVDPRLRIEITLVLDAVGLHGEILAAAAHAALHFVGDQQRAVPFRRFT